MYGFKLFSPYRNNTKLLKTLNYVMGHESWDMSTKIFEGDHIPLSTLGNFLSGYISSM